MKLKPQQKTFGILILLLLLLLIISAKKESFVQSSSICSSYNTASSGVNHIKQINDCLSARCIVSADKTTLAMTQSGGIIAPVGAEACLSDAILGDYSYQMLCVNSPSVNPFLSSNIGTANKACFRNVTSSGIASEAHPTGATRCGVPYYICVQLDLSNPTDYAYYQNSVCGTDAISQIGSVVNEYVPIDISCQMKGYALLLLIGVIILAVI